jgi:gas vesicle protein GvpL/GvpF
MAAATYLYCVIKAAPKPSLTGVPPGLAGGTPPQLLQGSPGLWLVASQVPLDTYGPGKLEPALADMDWVGRTAMAHEAVVEFFASRAGVTVVPMKLFTMFSTPHRALADIAERRRTIEAAMRRIAGAEEWGIRVLRSPSGAAIASQPAAARSGAAYLVAKKQKRDDAQQVQVAAAEAAATAFARLSSLAKASKRRDDTPPAGAAPPLLDAAFLVPLSHRDRFRTAARREADACARAGAQLTLTGPWPAYNFIQVEERG